MAGSLAFATTPPARTWHAAPRRRERLGVLRPPAMRPLLLALVFLGATARALDVAAIAMAGRQHASWPAGTLSAAFPAAGLLGGALFARLQPANGTSPREPLLLGAAYAVCWFPLLAPLPAPAVLLLALLPGALFVPLLTVAGLRVTTLARGARPPRRSAGSPAPCVSAWPPVPPWPARSAATSPSR
ncbi:hypothetical protein [Streptomyces sp. NPDC046870]|uniref:hypothetical protein n=1 Tax=Streptomyces sp. NPDC046870 TaxID=3155135 RepID=UPI003453FBCE